MPRARPVELHANSKGKKHLKFQEIIRSEGTYLFYPMDGVRKNNVYVKAALVAPKKGVHLNDSFHDVIYDAENSILAIPISLIQHELTSSTVFTGKVSAEKTFLFDKQESHSFIDNYCNTCDFCESPACYIDSGGYCANEEERTFYKEPAGLQFRRNQLENIKENRIKRRKIAFPY